MPCGKSIMYFYARITSVRFCSLQNSDPFSPSSLGCFLAVFDGKCVCYKVNFTIIRSTIIRSSSIQLICTLKYWVSRCYFNKNINQPTNIWNRCIFRPITFLLSRRTYLKLALLCDIWPGCQFSKRTSRTQWLSFFPPMNQHKHILLWNNPILMWIVKM